MQAEKTLVIYTSTEDPRRTLRHNTQIVLTVTPRNQQNLFVSQTPVAWKVLDFPAQSEIQESVTWRSDAAFAVAGRTAQTRPVDLGRSAVLRNVGGLTTLDDAVGDRGYVMARNETKVPQAFILGTSDIDNEFEGFVRFVATPAGGAVRTEPAVLLQAYALRGFKVGQPLSQVDSSSFIFRKYDGTPQPLDLTTLVNGTSLKLSSDATGRLNLEL